MRLPAKVRRQLTGARQHRGLDAALSGVVARVPVPVQLAVDRPHRPSPTIETVAYFVVSEALANVVSVAPVDGKFSTSSPVGGPTIVSVELPCAL